MPEEQRVQSQTLALLGLIVLCLFWLLAPSVKALFEPAGEDVAHPAIRATAMPPVLLWFVGAPILFAARSVTLRRPELFGARIVWALGCVLLLLHIAVAFHLGHGWSHAAAWEHTRQAGGYGDGVFVNYAFALVWL